MDTLDQIQNNLWTSDYVQANPNKAYKTQYNAEYLAVAAYINGGARPDTTNYSKMGRTLVGLEDQIRAGQTTPPDPDPDPAPDPGTLPFALPQLRSGYNILTVAANSQNVTAPAGKDCLIKLENIERTIGSLLIWGSGDQRIQVQDGHWNVTKPIDSSPYWRGGPRIRTADGIGPAHVSLTNMFIQGSSVPDGIALAASKNTKVTIQRWRGESHWVYDHTDLPEPAEHCDALQVQGPIGDVEIGLSTVWCHNVAPNNEGGKCFQLKNEGGNDGFSVTMKKVNMRGGGRTGTFLLQTTRDIPVTLEEVYANDDGITTGNNWNWNTSGGGMFYPNSSAGGIGWTRSGSAGSYVADWPDAAAVYGQIKQGLPPGGDFCTRAMLGY